MAKEFIVAIELGSSKVVGIAGKKNIDGSISVLASVKEESSSYIRKGIVRNIDKTAQCISGIVRKLSTSLKTEISRVYVGVGGQSIHSERNTVQRNLEPDTIVTEGMINALQDANLEMEYPDRKILDVAIQEYKLDNREETDPVGMQCTRLEGNFLNILWRKTFYRNLEKCFEQAGVAIAEMYLAPLALADSVLTDAEKRSGCVLVDLGADTTTVSVYYKNILRHLAVIPLGGNNITKDIASLQMEESRAEAMKLQYGRAYTDNADIDDTQMLDIDTDRYVKSSRFIKIVEGRLWEIIENVNYQIPDEYAKNLLGGIIITGGGANMKDIERAFRTHTKTEKVRVAKFVTHSITAKDLNITSKNAMMNTALALLAKGEMNCAGQPLNANGGLFDEGKPTTSTDGGKDTRRVSEPGRGVVLTDTEKQKIEEKKQQGGADGDTEKTSKQGEEDPQKSKDVRSVGKRIGTFFRNLLTEDE